MLQDIRFAIRSLLRRKGMLALAVATLALGVGASTSLFTVVNGVLLQPLPYRAPERLAILWHVFGQGAQDLPALHPLDYRDYRERSRTLEELPIATGQQWVLGGDPGIIGKPILLNNQPVEVVGVMPETFRLELPAETYALRDSDIWHPARINFERQPPRNLTAYTVFARLTPGATFAQAQEELSTIAGQLREEVAVHKDRRAAGAGRHAVSGAVADSAPRTRPRGDWRGYRDHRRHRGAQGGRDAALRRQLAGRGDVRRRGAVPDGGRRRCVLDSGLSRLADRSAGRPETGLN